MRLTASTTGLNLDPDGYTYSVDGGASAALGPTQTVILNGLNAGAHELAIGGVASNCTLDDGTPRAIVLIPGDTPDIRLTITCQAPASPAALTLTTSTTGGDIDFDGYTFALDGDAAIPIGPNSFGSVTGLLPGTHATALVTNEAAIVFIRWRLSGSAAGYNMTRGASEPLTPLEPADLEQKAPPDQLRTEPLRQLPCGLGRATGGQHVIDHQDPVPRSQGISMGFKRVAPVLEIVGFGDTLPGQLPRLPGRHESGSKRDSNRPPQDEPSRFDSHHVGDLAVAERTAQVRDDVLKQATVPENWSDILK